MQECLPEELRGPSTTITRIAAGLSGAGVYRVEAGGCAYVLKISGGDEASVRDFSGADEWTERVAIRRRAAEAGLTPRVVHVDEAHHAVVSELVEDRSFVAWYFGARGAAIAELGRTLRHVHALPLPAVRAIDPRSILAQGAPGPAFVGDALRRVLAGEPPPAGEIVLSHNDVNPSNLIYDGTRVLLLDWDVAGPNDRYYDLAAIAVFLRMDDATCGELIAAYDAPVAELPARFIYDRRLVAVLCGVMGLRMGAPPADATLETTPSLGEFYGRMRTGAVSLATPEGRAQFGLALIKESLAW